MRSQSYLSVKSADGSDIIFPVITPPAFAPKNVHPLLQQTRMKDNRLVVRRKEEMIKSRLSRIESRPQFAAAAVSRYSSQLQGISATPSTPPSPDEPEEQEDLLSLGRVVNRRKSGVPQKSQVVKLVKHPESAVGRLASIKT